jgi:hypothetical protein
MKLRSLTANGVFVAPITLSWPPEGVLARATNDVGWAYDLAQVLWDAGFDHARRILFTGYDIVVLSFDVQGVTCPRISSAATPR